MEFIAKWNEAAAAKDFASIDALLAPGVWLDSPVAHKRIDDRRAILAILGAVVRVLPDMRYTRCEETNSGAVMVFTGTLANGLTIEGLDLFTLGADERATALTVFVRPLKAATAFAEAMGAALGR